MSQIVLYDVKEKERFQDEKCNIVHMNQDKSADVVTGITILQELQSEDEFVKLLQEENWGVTQTVDSNILFFDLDTDKYDHSLDKLFNRSRTKYQGDNEERVISKHGFVKVIDGDHNWCKQFREKYCKHYNIEVYSEGHWVIFGGSYQNNHNKVNPTRLTKWFSLDDLHTEPIIQMTKEELGLIFKNINPTNNSKTTSVKAGNHQRHNFILSKLRQICKKLDKEDELTNERVRQKILKVKSIEDIHEYDTESIKIKELDEMINWSIQTHYLKSLDYSTSFVQSSGDYYVHVINHNDEYNLFVWKDKEWTLDSSTVS